MYKNSLFFIFIFSFIAISQLASGQNNTNSPYTRFAYGELNDNNSGEQRALGGLAIGLRNKGSINTVNPASYSSVDSLTFMFDIGVSALGSRFSDPSAKKSSLTSNLEYITMQFPLWKNFGFSAGLLPYSFSGYNFYSTGTLNTEIYPDSVKYNELYVGSGAISQVYAGLSYNLFNHLSIGVNGYYMFGQMSNVKDLSFTNNTTDFHGTTQSKDMTMSNFRFRLGLQAYNTFNKKHTVTLGAIYEPKASMNGTFKEVTSGVLVEYTPDSLFDNVFETPEIFGFGLNYSYKSSINVGVDYSLQKWGDALFFGKTDSLRNRSKISLGLEYVPNPLGRKYSDRIHYRAGLSLTDPYYKINGTTPAKTFGISFGIGIPLRTSPALVNATFEYGKVGSSTMLREDYMRFTLNVPFIESWFFKRKL